MRRTISTHLAMLHAMLTAEFPAAAILSPIEPRTAVTDGRPMPAPEQPTRMGFQRTPDAAGCTAIEAAQRRRERRARRPQGVTR